MITTKNSSSLTPQSLMAQSSLAIKAPAGRMVLSDGVVRPLPERGLLCIFRDLLMDELVLLWTSTDGVDEHQYTLPRGKVKVSWVEKCTSGRVLLFDIDNGKQLCFFWMQSRSSELDDTLMKKLRIVLERHGNSSIAPRRLPEIQMPTLRKLLREVRETSLMQDVDLPSFLSSSKLIEAVSEDPEFYTAKLKDYLPSSEANMLSDGASIDLAKLLQDPQVQWAAVIFGVMLRRESTNVYLSSLFLDSPGSWHVGVLAFIMQIIQSSSREGGKNR